MLRGRESTNVEDRRGMSGRGVAAGGGGIGILVLALAIYLCGGDPRALLEQVTTNAPPTTQQQPQQNTQTNDDQAKFVRSVLGSTEDVWGKVLPEQARVRYSAPKLVLFNDQTASACGYASSASGPFYCPGDQKLSLDFAFFRELKSEFKAPGDFAQAYVIAHEVGHHVQNLLGTMDKVQQTDGPLPTRLGSARCFDGLQDRLLHFPPFQSHLA